MKSTAVVILNFNGLHFLRQFLSNVVQSSPEADVIVIDNASTDASVAYIEDTFKEIKLIRLDHNNGFAGGYNKGIELIKHEFLFLLNSDVELTPNWHAPLLSRISQSEKTAVVQPKILDFHHKSRFEYAGAAGGHVDMFGYAFCKGRVFDTCEEDKGQYQDAEKVFWASGAAFFVKNHIFKEMGGFDDRFFAHQEEIDLCWRMQNHGYEIQYEPLSTVHHVGGGTLHKSNPFKTFLNYRNNLAMMYKNLPSWALFTIIPIRLILDGVSSLKFLKEGKWRDIVAILKAHFAFYAMVPYLRSKRSQTKSGFSKLKKTSIIWKYFVQNRKTYPEVCSK